MSESKKSTGSTGESSGPGIFDIIWFAVKDIPALMRSMKFAVWVLVILAIFTLAGTILPQEHLSADPVDFGNKYAAMFNVDPADGRTTIGEFVYYRIVVPLELYRVFDTGLYFVLLALLAVSSTLCAWDRLLISRVILKRTKAIVAAGAIDRLPWKADGITALPIDKAAEVLDESIKQHGFQVFRESDESGAEWFFARKNAFRHIVSVIFHMAFVLVLIGGVIGHERVMGYQGSFMIAEGGTSPLGSEIERARRTGESPQSAPNTSGEYIELLDYLNIYREEDFGSLDPDTGFPVDYMGMPSDYVSRLRIVRVDEGAEGTVVLEREVEVNRPMRYKGVAYYQSSFDYMIYMTVIDQGNSIPIQARLNVPFVIPGLDMQSAITQADIVGGIWEAKDGTRTEMPYAIRLNDYTDMFAGRTDHPQFLGTLSAEKPLAIDGVVIRLDEVEEFTVLQYSHNPGIPLIFIGGFLLVLGLTVALYMPYRSGRIVLRSSEGKTEYKAGGDSSDFVVSVETLLERGTDT